MHEGGRDPESTAPADTSAAADASEAEAAEGVAALHAAVADCRSQLAALDELLAADPENADVRELHDQLQGALAGTLEALAAAEGGGQGEPGGGPAEAEAAAAQQAAFAPPRGGAAGNARMHPANRYYRSEPDFAALAEAYDELRPYVTTDAAGRGHLDTTSWEATRALTACLLRHDFGVAWWLPPGQLVPPVTNRANYLHWINDLLALSDPGDGGPIRGMDVGCGANFIYCLLGAVLYGWSMVGVDVTKVAVKCCHKLIRENAKLAPLLEVRDLSALHPELQSPDAAAPAGAGARDAKRRGRKRPAEGQDPEQPERAAEEGSAGGDAAGAEGAAEEPEAGGAAAGEEGAAGRGDGGEGAEEAADELGNSAGILLPAFTDEQETFAFTVCNPPFFESMHEAAQNPNTAFGGTSAEMVCPGGELAFVLRMVVESEELQERVHWFTTMVGKKTTLKAIRKELHSRSVTALRTTELAQGRTSRWAVAWSWRVPPNKATEPLRRHEAPPGQEGAAAPGAEEDAGEGRRGAAGSARPDGRQGGGAAAAAAPTLAVVLPRRYVSFTAMQPDARALLGRLAELLKKAGSTDVAVDPATWSCSWPLQISAFSGGEAGGGGGGQFASDITARMRVAQQQRGRMEVVGTIPNHAPDNAARAFASLMAGLQADLEAAGVRVLAPQR
ncbi:hypothetical protein HYH03_008735 [Edaphochlamys debaryana]|uniref:U6 small nuclear RNA (adenine-(43)-N(6))-methyltransferase n=1 Tax=Edaphochlamys debaryana TaxID=47281 RepID=A0A835Y0M7_9CHLO|nr:hypothetical protein HYH03_008735 [Edaphochlamys debaryana]|eukprot:KAG2493072.1 hypothetical protein HYH03_008735 [Edaphochlamys debaryana]